MNLNFTKHLSLFFFLVLFSSALFANKTAINPSIESIELLVDSSKTLTLKEIESSSKFEAIKNGYSNPHKAFNYWFRIKIQANELQQKKHYLTINAALHFDLACYYYLNDSIISQKCGFLNKETIEHNNSNPGFEIIIPDTNLLYVYIKLNTFGETENFHFDVLTEKEFHRSQENQQFTFGIFYGILIVIIIINIFYFFSLNRKAFLFYATYVFLTIFFCSYFDGIPLLGLINTVGEYHRFLVLASILLYFGFMPFMAIHYIQLEKVNRKLLKISLGYLLFVIGSLIVAIFFSSDSAYEYYLSYHNLTVIAGGILTIIIGIKGLKNNKILGRSFLISISIILLSFVISVLEDYGFTSFNIYFDLVKLGSLLEIIILSLALALYFRDIDRNLVKKSNELDILSNDYEEAREQFSHLEGRFLRSQMNPHFIFNAMSSIQNFILNKENKMAHEYLSKFSKLVRNVLEFSRKDFICLQDEIDTLSVYIELEKLRASNKFNYLIKIDEGVNPEMCSVPSMLIQPFIENAILHGLFPKKGNDGLLTIHFEQKDEQLLCTIEDNGIGREKSGEIRDKKEKYHQSMGMSVTKDRLEILKNINRLDAGYTIEDLYDDNKLALGTRVIIQLPLSF